MRVDVVTLFPAMFDALTQQGVTGRAIQRGVLQLGLWNVRDYTHDRHRTVDDRPYGGGPGMVMQVVPLRETINAARAAQDVQVSREAGMPEATAAQDVQVSREGRSSASCARGTCPSVDGAGMPEATAADAAPGRVIYLSPQGRRLDQAGVRELAAVPRMILVAGRYEGVDERVLQADIDEEWSVGDYVLSGGELAAMVMIDAVARLLPGVLGHEDSAQQDSFADDGLGLLDYPHYTRPEEVDGARVPEVLLSGDHQAIACWRQKQALGRTWLRRPDLLVASGILPPATLAPGRMPKCGERRDAQEPPHPCAAEAGMLNPAQKKLLDEFIREYYGSFSQK